MAVRLPRRRGQALGAVSTRAIVAALDAAGIAYHRSGGDHIMDLTGAPHITFGRAGLGPETMARVLRRLEQAPNCPVERFIEHLYGRPKGSGAGSSNGSGNGGDRSGLT